MLGLAQSLWSEAPTCEKISKTLVKRPGVEPFVPSVSVVIPARNAERYLAAAINSVLAQTWQDFELIVVDDESTDDTCSVCRSFTDKRVKLVQQAHRGSSAARNLGITCSTGKYLAFLDADDEWLPDKLEQQVRHLEREPAVGLSFCCCEFVNREGRRLGLGICPPAARLKRPSAEWMLLSNPTGCGSTAVVRRDALEQITSAAGTVTPGCFDESLEGYDDVDCWLRILLFTKFTAAGLPAILVRYRITPGSNSFQRELMEAAFEQLIVKLQKTAPQFIEPRETLARAFFWRYMAQKEILRESCSPLAFSFIKKAMAANPRLFTRDPLVTSGTAAAAALIPALPLSISETFRTAVFFSFGALQRLSLSIRRAL